MERTRLVGRGWAGAVGQALQELQHRSNSKGLAELGSEPTSAGLSAPVLTTTPPLPEHLPCSLSKYWWGWTKTPASHQRMTARVSVSQPDDGGSAPMLPGGPQAGRPQPVPLLLESGVGPRPCPIPVSLIWALSQGSPRSLANPGPVSSATRAWPSCPEALLDLSCFLHPVVSSFSSAGPLWPWGGGGHTNPRDFHSPLGAAAQASTRCPLLPPTGRKRPCADISSSLHVYSPPGNFVSGPFGITLPTSTSWCRG